MCKLASFVVTKDRVLWHPESDSHEKIVEHFKLDDKRPDFVRVELAPPRDDYLLPIKAWKFRTDQKDTPEWYSAKTEEIEVRSMMAKWKKDRSWFFDAMDFVGTIKDVDFFSGKGRALRAWKMFDSRDAARAGAKATVRDVARDAAEAVAEDAALATARDAAVTAARDAARDVVRDAALLARCLVVSDKIDPKHLNHARTRWAVWQAGYGLLCDVDGVLYVYRKP